MSVILFPVHCAVMDTFCKQLANLAANDLSDVKHAIVLVVLPVFQDIFWLLLVALHANLLTVTVPLATQGVAPAVKVDISLTEQLAVIVL